MSPRFSGKVCIIERGYLKFSGFSKKRLFRRCLYLKDQVLRINALNRSIDQAEGLHNHTGRERADDRKGSGTGSNAATWLP